MEIHADDHTERDGNHTENRGNSHGCVAAVHHETKNNSNYDKQQGYHSDRCVCRGGCLINCTRFVHHCAEGSRHDGCKCGNHKDQCQISKNGKQHLRSLAHVGGNDLTDGLSFVTDGCEKRAKVMNAAEEDTTDQNPEHNRNPAEHSRANRSGDRACTRDRREVVTHQHGRLSGNIVHTVFHLMSRGRLLAFAHTPLFAKPSAVEYVADDKNCNTDD